LRKEAPTELEKAFWKEVTNSCYGEDGRRASAEKRVVQFKITEYEAGPGKAQSRNPFFAAYITSLVPCRPLGEIMNAIPSDKNGYSASRTDGFPYQCDFPERNRPGQQQGQLLVLSARLGKRLTGSADINREEACRLKRLLGIRHAWVKRR